MRALRRWSKGRSTYVLQLPLEGPIAGVPVANEVRTEDGSLTAPVAVVGELESVGKRLATLVHRQGAEQL